MTDQPNPNLFDRPLVGTNELNFQIFSLLSRIIFQKETLHFRTNPEQQEKNELKERFPLENLKKLSALVAEYYALPNIARVLPSPYRLKIKKNSKIVNAVFLSFTEYSKNKKKF